MELWERIKRDFRFEKDEVVGLLVSSLAFGFIFFYNFRDTLGNFIASVVIVAISLVFHIAAQKIVGLHLGVKVEYKLWWYGILAGLIAVFVSNGKVWWLIVPGGVVCSLIAKYRLGRFYYGLNYVVLGAVGWTGPVASIIFASLFKNLNMYFLSVPIPLFQKIFIWNLVFAVFSLIPIPPLDGHYTFFAGRLTYAFVAGSIAVYCLLILILGVYSFVWALIGGAIIYVVYLVTFELGAWYR